MTREDERLNRIEAGLGPQELVYLWLEEAQRFPSLPAYAGWLSTQPDEVYPLIRLPRLAEEGVRARLRAKLPAMVEEAVREAHRDVFFLFYLVKEVNLHMLHEKDALRYRGVLLVERLRELLPQQAPSEDIARALEYQRLAVDGPEAAFALAETVI